LIQEEHFTNSLTVCFGQYLPLPAGALTSEVHTPETHHCYKNKKINYTKLRTCIIEQIYRKQYKYLILIFFVCFNATFSNISAISMRSVLEVEEAGVPGENHRPCASNWQTLSLASVSRVHPFCYLQS
jgi:hypothetical protein